MQSFRFGLIGFPLQRSLSPIIHQEFYKYYQIEADYDLLPTDPQELPHCLQRLRAEGYLGINVTIPFKTAILRQLNRISPEVEDIGAVNTVHITMEEIYGVNTDYLGALHELDVIFRRNLDVLKTSAVVLGCGGASRATIRALIDSDVASIFVWGRNPDTCALYVEELNNSFFNTKRVCKRIDYFDFSVIRRLVADNDVLIVNTTPVGQLTQDIPGDFLTIFASNFRNAFFWDLVYDYSAAGRTLLTQLATKCRLARTDGLGMLIKQALYAEKTWLDNFISIESAQIEELTSLVRLALQKEFKR